MRVEGVDEGGLPSVVFIAQLEIAHDDGDLGTGDHKDHQNDEEKAKHEI